MEDKYGNEKTRKEITNSKMKATHKKMKGNT